PRPSSAWCSRTARCRNRRRLDHGAPRPSARRRGGGRKRHPPYENRISAVYPSRKHRGRTRRRVEDCEASSTRLYRAKPSTWKAPTIPTAEHLPIRHAQKKRQHHAGVCSFKLQLSAISYQLSAAGTLCIAQCLDLVMVALHALELALDHHADIGRQVFVERLAIALQGHILATLALVEDGFIILAGNQRFEIDPAPM